MKKIKEWWNNNRVMFVLGIIVTICIILIFIVMFQYFFGTAKSSYGDRLDDISSLPFDASDKDLLLEHLNSEHTISSSVEVKGKVIYIMATFDSEVSLVDAQNKVVDAYEALDGKYKKYYDFNATISQDPANVNAYILMGAKNVSSDNFIWSNNTPVNDGE